MILPISVGIYKKHVAFWAVLGLVFWGSVSFIGGQKSLADVTGDISTPEAGSQLQSQITIANNGQALTDGKAMNATITPLKDTDQVRIILLDKPGTDVSNADIVVTLPPTTQVSSLKIIPRLVHSFDDVVDLTYLSDNSFELRTNDISGEATFSLELDFPKGALNLSVPTKITGILIGYSLYGWLIIGSLLPLLAFIILIGLLARDYKVKSFKNRKNILEEPPSNLPPAVAEVLISGHLSSRSLAATLVDLARRGYVVISYHGEDFRFGKNKKFSLPMQPLGQQGDNIPAILQSIALTKDGTDIAYFERLLLSKLFTNEDFVIDRKELEMRLGHRLFSEKIAASYNEIYDQATKLKLFVENPSVYHHKFKFYGLILFFVGFFGFLVGALRFPEPKTALLGWVGMMLASYAIIRVSPRLPILSDTGLEEYRKWIAFRNYLKDPNPLFYTEKTPAQFDAYLPYAIALGVEKEWSARFREHPLRLPGWFVSPKEMASLQDFDIELFPLIDWVSKNLSLARTPIVD